MALKIEDFAKDVESCLSECLEAISAVIKTYSETSEDVKNMSDDEKKTFLVEALKYLYSKADKQWEFPDIMDAVALSIAIPQGTEYVFKFVNKD